MNLLTSQEAPWSPVANVSFVVALKRHKNWVTDPTLHMTEHSLQTSPDIHWKSGQFDLHWLKTTPPPRTQGWLFWWPAFILKYLITTRSGLWGWWVKALSRNQKDLEEQSQSNTFLGKNTGSVDCSKVELQTCQTLYRELELKMNLGSFQCLLAMKTRAGFLSSLPQFLYLWGEQDGGRTSCSIY